MGDPILIGIRFALYADLMLIAGLAAFALHALDADERRNPVLTERIWRAERWLCVAGLAVSTLGFAVLAASMFGVGILDLEAASVGELIVQTDMGVAWLARNAALMVALAATFSLRQRPTGAAIVAATAGAFALASLVWTGHAGASEGAGGSLHRISDIVHMIAAAIWVGAIAGFLLWLAPRPAAPESPRLEVAGRSLERFSRTGTICVLLIAATGLINTQMTIGIPGLSSAHASPYGRLLLAKLILFSIMLAIAAANRWRLVPALKQFQGTASTLGSARSLASEVAALRRSLLVEGGAALTILGLVAWLGTLPPGTGSNGN
ncbi:copper homeostasis membrane protein CopD [Sphingopyxis sp. XHP0097]|uniref:Copper homeostasis membrane protein CopD n=1 Tax=Sphingopyxis jiangsuensis TaxID=2871171 RepID=A0ABS7MAX1_9SPHN|nr:MULTISPECIES: copper homeostasis membrane protein CopD [Sphingopyxis]MBY4636155.1 copper homeostasis membrane protein CopD [Sphingopyxis jiangsuensis]